jgi:hypothetical protein
MSILLERLNPLSELFLSDAERRRNVIRSWGLLVSLMTDKYFIFLDNSVIELHFNILHPIVTPGALCSSVAKWSD